MVAEPLQASDRSPFDVFSAARLGSPSLERSWQEAYGDNYPETVRPNGFYPRAVLTRIAEAIGPGTNGLLVDSGCGHGGVGIWLAEHLGMRLVGHDPSAGSISFAKQWAERAGIAARSDFHVGDLVSLDLPLRSCTAIISMDVLLFVPDKSAFMRQAARIVRPGGVLAFTTWEQDGGTTRLDAPQLADYRPLATAAGFEIEFYEEPDAWREQQAKLLHLIISRQHAIALEVGEKAADAFSEMAVGALDELPMRRYVLAIARRH